MAKNAKKKPEKVSKEELIRRMSETSGMQPDEVVKLLETLANAERDTKIVLRKPGKKSGKRLFGLIPEKRMDILDALEHAREQEEKWEEYEKKLSKKNESKKHEPLNKADFPKPLLPKDIARSIEGAKKRLEEKDRRKTIDTLAERKAELIFNIVQNLKKQQTVRLAKRIAMKQQLLYETLLKMHGGEYVPLEHEPKENDGPENDENTVEWGERNLDGFQKGSMSLLDEAADVVEHDYDAAANVVKQWVGHQSNED